MVNVNIDNGRPNVLVLTGYGINCDEETAYAFEQAGARADIVHVNDLIDKRRKLQDYQILAFPGGFSYGDDTGAGNGLANRIRNHLWDELMGFVHDDKLGIGICNGFQVMVNLGLLPSFDGKYGEQNVALINNDFPRYSDRWCDIRIEGKGPWIQGIKDLTFPMPIAHGEGKFFASLNVLRKIEDRRLIVARYVQGNICEDHNLPANPNGSLEDIAGIIDETGRLFGMMPHPERAIDYTQLPDWTLKREILKVAGHSTKVLEDFRPGLEVFKNGVSYFK